MTNSRPSTVAELSDRLEALKSGRRTRVGKQVRVDPPAPPNQFDVRVEKILPSALRVMIAVEQLIVGLLASLTLAAVAVFASSIPYIYASADPDMRCGAFALIDASLFEITSGLQGVVFLIVLFLICRAFIKLTNTNDFRLLMFVPTTLWLIGVYAGYAAFDSQLLLLNTKFLVAFPPLSAIGQSRDEETCQSLIKHPPTGRLLPSFLLHWNDTYILRSKPS